MQAMLIEDSDAVVLKEPRTLGVCKAKRVAKCNYRSFRITVFSFGLLIAAVVLVGYSIGSSTEPYYESPAVEETVSRLDWMDQQAIALVSQDEASLVAESKHLVKEVSMNLCGRFLAPGGGGHTHCQLPAADLETANMCHDLFYLCRKPVSSTTAERLLELFGYLHDHKEDPDTTELCKDYDDVTVEVANPLDPQQRDLVRLRNIDFGLDCLCLTPKPADCFLKTFLMINEMEDVLADGFDSEQTSAEIQQQLAHVFNLQSDGDSVPVPEPTEPTETANQPAVVPETGTATESTDSPTDPTNPTDPGAGTTTDPAGGGDASGQGSGKPLLPENGGQDGPDSGEGGTPTRVDCKSGIYFDLSKQIYRVCFDYAPFVDCHAEFSVGNLEPKKCISSTCLMQPYGKAVGFQMGGLIQACAASEVGKNDGTVSFGLKVCLSFLKDFVKFARHKLPIIGTFLRMKFGIDDFGCMTLATVEYNFGTERVSVDMSKETDFGVVMAGIILRVEFSPNARSIPADIEPDSYDLMSWELQGEYCVNEARYLRPYVAFTYGSQFILPERQIINKRSSNSYAVARQVPEAYSCGGN